MNFKIYFYEFLLQKKNLSLNFILVVIINTINMFTLNMDNP